MEIYTLYLTVTISYVVDNCNVFCLLSWISKLDNSCLYGLLLPKLL